MSKSGARPMSIALSCRALLHSATIIFQPIEAVIVRDAVSLMSAAFLVTLLLAGQAAFGGTCRPDSPANACGSCRFESDCGGDANGVFYCHAEFPEACGPGVVEYRPTESVRAVVPRDLLETLARLVCGNSFMRKDGEPLSRSLGCRRCPRYTGDAVDGHDSEYDILAFTLENSFRGSFTSSGQDEVMSVWHGCECHAMNFGGSVLFRRSGSSWNIVRYDQGFRPDGCRVRSKGGGIDELVCHISFVQHGELTESTVVWNPNGK